MHSLNLKLNQANEDDLAIVTNLATRIWNEYYITIISRAQIDYMLNLMYSQQSLLEQLMVKHHQFYLIYLEGIAIGFISVNKENDGEWFLNKFYILTQQAAKGIGSMVFNELKKVIQPKKITLTVNRQNYKSINFYFKNNFKIERVADFDIGNGYVMNDFVMVWEDN
jgi:diamine N-acetyltransferase